MRVTRPINHGSSSDKRQNGPGQAVLEADGSGPALGFAPSYSIGGSASNLRVEETPHDAAVGVDAPVAQERPVPADILLVPRVAFDQDQFLALVRGPVEHAAERIAEKRGAPELQAAAGRPFMADPVD